MEIMHVHFELIDCEVNVEIECINRISWGKYTHSITVMAHLLSYKSYHHYYIWYVVLVALHCTLVLGDRKNKLCGARRTPRIFRWSGLILRLYMILKTMLQKSCYKYDSNITMFTIAFVQVYYNYSLPLGACLHGSSDLHFCHTNLNDAKYNFIFLNGFWFQNVIGIAHAQIGNIDAHKCMQIFV